MVYIAEVIGRMERKIRKFRNNMMTSGMAVIVFTVWDIVKLVISLLLDTTYKNYYMAFLHRDNVVLLFLEIFFFVFFVALIGAVQGFVGISAIRIGRGARHRNAYLVVCAVIWGITVYSLVYSFKGGDGMSLDISLASFLLDLTMLVALTDLFVSSIIVRHLEKKAAMKVTANMQT